MRKLLLTAGALLVMASVCGAQGTDPANTDEQKKANEESRKISVALSVGAFFPTSSETKDIFDDSWTRISLSTFQRKRPERWLFGAELSGLQFDGPVDLDLYALTFGFTKGLTKETSSMVPYVSGRVGPYWGKIRDNLADESTSKVGLNANAEVGLLFNETFYVEARYDMFSKLAGVRLDGFSITAGVRLFDFKL